MKRDLRKPCDDCAFRKKAIKGWLGPYNSPGELRYVIENAPFACHKTIKEDLDYEDERTQELQMCAGAAIHLNNQFARSKNKEMAEYQDELKSVEQETKDSVFKWPHEFEEYHTLNEESFA